MAKVITIRLVLHGSSFRQRLVLLPFLFKQPLVQRAEIKKEYAEWRRMGIFRNKVQKTAYILDHFVLWYFYCIIFLFREHASGFRWQRKSVDYILNGIKIKV